MPSQENFKNPPRSVAANFIKLLSLRVLALQLRMMSDMHCLSNYVPIRRSVCPVAPFAADVVPYVVNLELTIQSFVGKLVQEECETLI